MNSIHPDLKFTTETAEYFPERRLHTLDTEIWIENNRVRHSYFQKEMKTPFVLMRASAMAGQSEVCYPQ